MYHYDETKDRSEEFGWKKICDEETPTEESQIFWGNVLMISCVVLAIIAIFF